ncbi:MAG: A24 family peptidase C-terminal domain-containing protein, partial [Candidatus Thermoplasmatota archaeon]
VLAATFPFAFIVLVNSAILFLVVPLVLLVRNAAKGDAKLPRALFGFRVPINAVPKYAWLLDRIEDGKPTFVLMPRRKEDREEQMRLLREHGYTKVWVTPQLPFVTAMLAGYALAVVAGNMLLALFRIGG